MGQTIAHSDYFKYVSQKVHLMTVEEMRKGEAWYVAHHNDNFDDIIFTANRFLFCICTPKRWAKFGKCPKMMLMFSQAVTL
jgi:hypothetical protein